MNIRKIALAAVKTTPVGFAASKIVDHVQAEKSAEPGEVAPPVAEAAAGPTERHLRREAKHTAKAEAKHAVQYWTMLGTLQKLTVTQDQIKFQRQSIPLAGARAAVTTSSSGAFGRTVNTVLTIVAADGQEIVYSFGGGFGTKGASSRSEEARIRKAAAKVNSLAAGRSAKPATTDALTQLASLHDSGLLTDDEFAAKRAEVMGRI
jgi:hypothetical protein